MTVVFNLINLVVLAERVVHDHDVVVVEILAIPELLVERLRSIGIGADNLALCIALAPCEFSWRHAISESKHTVDLAKHLDLLVLQLLVGHLLAFAHCTEFETLLTEELLHDRCKTTSVVALESLRESLLRHDTILGNKVGNTAECTAIRQWVLEEPIDHAVVERLLASIDHTLKIEVGLLKLIVEEEIVL